jgi:hypothetical protein
MPKKTKKPTTLALVPSIPDAEIVSEERVARVGAGSPQPPSPITDLVDIVRGGIDAIGDLGRAIMKPIGDVFDGLFKAERAAKIIAIAAIGGYAYMKLRPQRVIITGDRTRRARSPSPRRRNGNRR